MLAWPSCTWRTLRVLWMHALTRLRPEFTQEVLGRSPQDCHPPRLGPRPGSPQTAFASPSFGLGEKEKKQKTKTKTTRKKNKQKTGAPKGGAGAGRCQSLRPESLLSACALSLVDLVVSSGSARKKRALTSTRGAHLRAKQRKKNPTPLMD